MSSAFARLRTLLLLTLLLTACVPLTILPTLPAVVTSSPQPSSTVTPSLTFTPSLTITPTDTLPPTATRTPPSLPGPFQASFLYEGDTPHAYLTDFCQYLRDKWASPSAAPGTVVMVIMFHAIGGETGGDRISENDFHALMQSLHDTGFEAITTVQLADFMEHNTWIPPRSVLLVVDDRHDRYYFDLFFRSYWETYGWQVVNAYISASRDGGDAANWADQEALNQEGWVDYQAHGVVHNAPMWPGVTDAYILSELQGSIDAFQLHFNKTPIAIIWPGGAFFDRPVEIARQLGYRLGFTVNPRGPLMFNWVPLADETDPLRPSWTPEGRLGDPLLVLPRYWDTDAAERIGDAVQLNLDAAAYAESNRQVELDYYNIICSPAYGPIP
jgi:Polysaccharide deacetylase